ncbi:Purine ribonucleoside efflux pump NepI [Marinomonas aquimarina]|uniref:Purine ribonucleoside efflux pump NepI n=1 Tax=Marinomonas aquimarina TaxID=295068 RepID=A0A1A8TKI4_9GAMM|nr:MFS transporter [Marinomonas aquimarina]SBS33454.1 Purine ribonucleoside efflux pump NepI [Marinomonas aquimarina]
MSTSQAAFEQAESSPASSNWWAILAMMLGVAALISAELLPVSLLTQMAQELNISMGIAGQMISTTAAVAMLSGLILPSLLIKVDRRHLILSFSLLLIISCFVTAQAQTFWTLLCARVLLGIAVGGFWAILAAVTMKLVPAERVGPAFSFIFSGVSLALVAAAPLGSYFGEQVGWRVVFVAVGVISIAIFALQLLTVPSVKSQREAHHDGIAKILKRPGVALAFIAMLLSFTGNQMLYIYMRPYMELYLGFNIEQISMSWVLFGVASFVGATFAGFLAQKALKQILLGMPFTMVIVAFALLLGQSIHPLAYFLIACWGFFGAVLPIIWSTWITKALPDAAEAAGGLYSAALQVAAIIGAALSGTFIDQFGVSSNMPLTGAVMMVTLVLTLASLQKKRIE